MNTATLNTLAEATLDEPLVRPMLKKRWSVEADGTLWSPSGITPLADGLMLVINECHHDLVVLDEVGRVVRRFGGEGTAAGRFRYPTHAAADRDGGVWVTDRWNHRIQHLDACGRAETVFGAYGTAPGELNEPWGIVTLADGRIAVADRSNHRLQLFQPDGTVSAIHGCGGYSAHFYESLAFKRGCVFDRWMILNNRFRSHEALFREQGYTLGTLEYPQGLCVLEEKRLVIANPGFQTIACCDLPDGHVESLVTPRSISFVPTNVTPLGGGRALALGDFGRTACLFDATGAAVFFNVPDVEYLTACAVGPDSTLWCLDGWNHRLVCYDGMFDSSGNDD